MADLSDITPEQQAELDAAAHAEHRKDRLRELNEAVRHWGAIAEAPANPRELADARARVAVAQGFLNTLTA